MLRRLLILALIMAGLAMIPIASTGTASAAPSGLPTGFRTVAYDAGMFQYDLTNFVVVPSTQSMVATGKSGRITRVDIAGDGLDPSDASPTIIAQVPTYYQGDRGVLGISLASDYLASGHLYLLWDYCQGQASNDQQCIPDGGTPTGRLSQFTVTGPTSKPTGIDLTSEVILMDGLPSWSPTPGQTCTDSHTIGTVLTAPNGTLFVGNGDGSGYCGAADPSALSAQDVTSPRGKIFHINPNGSPTSDDIVGSYQGKVWAYGFRNPFRFSYSNGVLMVGDVGWNTWEEQNVVHAGENFGWPCLEGADATTTGFFSSPVCQANKSSFVSAFILWSHFESGRPAQSAAVGGVFAPTSWPTPYNGAYIFGDYARGDLFASDHNTPFGTLGSWGGITSIQNGLFSDVYVTDIGAAGPGKITRIHFDNPTNSPPTVAIQGAPLVGKAPLHVQWTTPQAADADGTVTAWTWDFGDGSSVQTGTGLPPAIDHVYTTPGQYKAVLTVTDNGGSSASATETVQVGNNPPILTVVQPPPGTTYHIGDPIHVQAATSDSDGDAVTLQYQPVIHHCPTPSDCHVHPSAFQSSPDFIFPNHGDDSPDYYLEIVVQATDSRGAVSTASVNYVLAPVVGQPPPPVPAPTPPPPPAPSPAQGLKFNPQPPQRLLDTRQDGHLGAAVPLSVNLVGHQAAMLTVTITNPTQTGYLRVYPCGTSPGDSQTSTVNYNGGQTISNVTIVNIPTDGSVCFWSLRTTDMIVDLNGYFDATGLGYTPITPQRVLDTRSGSPLGAMQQAVFNFGGEPAGTEAAMMNLTVTNPQAAGFLRAYPCGAEDGTANINYDQSQTIANFAAVSTPGGTMCFRSFAQTDLISDIAGFYTDSGGLSLTTVDPTRLFDTRSTTGFTRLQAGKESRILMGLPNNAAAGVFNITVADPSADGYIQVYPCGTNPTTSSVNYVAHQTAAANLTVVQIPTSGAFAGQACFKSFADTDLILDVSGWFS